MSSKSSLIVKHSIVGKITIIFIYMDDIISTWDSGNEVTNLKEFFLHEFEVKDLGILKHFLAMEVAPLKKGIVVSK